MSWWVWNRYAAGIASVSDDEDEFDADEFGDDDEDDDEDDGVKEIDLEEERPKKKAKGNAK